MTVFNCYRVITIADNSTDTIISFDINVFKLNIFKGGAVCIAKEAHRTHFLNRLG
ncbi:hypothetical protein SDC9_167643 [bioreactor metagenome]|uniref:Uncharacterized protein n=1 Tax=bioreactor metagenome TaxID=1076179 RepID=A0A645G0U3_9ZZZZ